jgi:hypothetical protein
MQRSPKIRLVALLVTGLLLSACADQPPAPTSPATIESAASSVGAAHATATVNWHAQQAGLGRTGPVDGASASLVRNANGVSFHLTTNSLTAGNAYTLWLVVVNNPDACASTPCTPADIFNPATQSQVRFAAGHVAGGSGQGTFAGSLQEGTISGWQPDRSFEDAMGVEVHLVINDHGPMLSAYMPGMIHTYRGGCSDASPFPAIFPATARADGEVGPNICRLYQAATFEAP